MTIWGIVSNFVLFHCFKRFSALWSSLWWKSDTNACPCSAGCQLSVKSGFKSIGPCKVEKVSEMSSSQNSIFPFICIAYTPDFRAHFGHLPVVPEGHKRMPMFSRMPAISQKWFQINRTLKGWRGLRNVTQKCHHLKIPYSHSFALPTHLTLGPILGTFLLAQRDTNACTRSAGCQLSVKSGFKSIGPWKVEEASEMSLRNVISKFHILIHLHCLHTWL